MNKHTPPKTLYLYWYTPEDGNGFLTTQTYKAISPNYTLVSALELDWGDLEFDETGTIIDSLTKQMGQKQAEINAIKGTIQELLCISHDVTPPPDGGVDYNWCDGVCDE